MHRRLLYTNARLIADIWGILAVGLLNVAFEKLELAVCFVLTWISSGTFIPVQATNPRA